MGEHTHTHRERLLFKKSFSLLFAALLLLRKLYFLELSLKGRMVQSTPQQGSPSALEDVCHETLHHTLLS